jgi:hypothetical protein
MNIRYRVTLSNDERTTLEPLISEGQGAVRRVKRAQILLAADAGVHRRGDCGPRRVGTATLAGEDVVHPVDERGLGCSHGGRARPLRRAIRSIAPGCLLGRDATAAHRLGPCSGACQARQATTRRLRLRLRAQRHRECLHVRRRQPALAPCQGDLPANVRRLRRMHAPYRGRKQRRFASSSTNLSAHSAAASYQTYEPAEARRILSRLESTSCPSTPAG